MAASIPFIKDKQRLYLLQCEDKVFAYRLETLLRYGSSPLTESLMKQDLARRCTSTSTPT